MSENKNSETKKTPSADWFVRGILTKLGETFDRLTGRNWKPSSNLATSELVERLKLLLDAEAKEEENLRFVPHHIQLKMQWDKFAVDTENSEKALKTLENELLVAAVDHINDRRYHTFAPLKLEIKPDYFTEGVKLQASFDEFAEDSGEINLAVSDLKNVVIEAPQEIAPEPEKQFFAVRFLIKGEQKNVTLAFTEGERKSVGRTKENDLWIDDAGVSKIHASLVFNREKGLLLADTGSTNGTFIGDERIPYGKAFPVESGKPVRFGTIAVSFEQIENRAAESAPAETEARETFAAENFSANEDLQQTAQGVLLDLSENK